MSFTQSDVEALEAAIKLGVKRVTYKDHTAEYHSMAEMIALRDMMRREANPSSGGNVIYAGRVT